MSANNPRPTSDFVFRCLFGTEGNEDLLIALLNAIIMPDVPIMKVVIKNPFNLADYDGSKETILDIKAMDQNGVWYDVEMQIYPHIVYGKRALFYGAQVYVDQLERGSDYSKLNTVICIHILGFNYFKDDDRMFRRVVLKDDETNEVYEDFRHLQFYFMELPKIDKDWTQLRTGRDQWAAFFKDGGELQPGNLPATLQSEPAIVKAVAELERIGLDPRQREIYEAQETKRMIEATQILYAKQEGRQEGEREILTLLGAQRFGEPDETVLASLNKIESPERLRWIASRLLAVESWQDLLAQ